MKHFIFVGGVFMAVFIHVSFQNPRLRKDVSAFPEPNLEIGQEDCDDCDAVKSNENIDQNMPNENIVLDDYEDIIDLFAKNIASQTFEIFEFEYENPQQKRNKRGLKKFFKRLEHSFKTRIDALLPVVANAVVQKIG